MEKDIQGLRNSDTVDALDESQYYKRCAAAAVPFPVNHQSRHKRIPSITRCNSLIYQVRDAAPMQHPGSVQHIFVIPVKI
jgi:hypothetical protein